MTVTKTIRLAFAAALASVAALAFAPPASAARLDGLRDARYCEIFTVTLSPPTATVWNTIGLNTCPATWWDRLDTTALATQAGVPVVVLNGPRHWVVDGVSEPHPGPVSKFAGQKLRKVATIDLSKIGTSHPPPYTTVTIGRDNTWHYAKHRPVFDLIDPTGRVYRMQAYSQIVKPALSYPDLRRLGSRLALPDGWRYRVTRLKHNFNLPANGRATILQDELQDTYQRLPKRLDASPAR